MFFNEEETPDGMGHRLKSNVDLQLAAFLDDREVLGRKGFAKVELIEKIQAVMRGHMVRRIMQVYRVIVKLRDVVSKLDVKVEAVREQIKKKGAYTYTIPALEKLSKESLELISGLFSAVS